MQRKLKNVSKAFTIVYRVGKQNIFPTNDQSKGDSLASRHKNGKFSKKKHVEKSIRSQQSLVEARATPRSQFDCPTNIAWTRTQEDEEVIVKNVCTFYTLSTTT